MAKTRQQRIALQRHGQSKNKLGDQQPARGYRDLPTELRVEAKRDNGLFVPSGHFQKIMGKSTKNRWRYGQCLCMDLSV